MWLKLFYLLKRALKIDTGNGYAGTGRTPTDYEYLGATEIIDEVLQEDGQWDAFLPDYEYQNEDGVEKWACVSYAILNCLEIVMRRKFAEKWDFSDRFTAVMSNTVRYVGNSFYAVIESIRKTHGFVSFLIWENKGATWEEWNKQIPPDKQSLAKKNLAELKIQYEWVPEPFTPDVLRMALKRSPLTVSVSTKWTLLDGLYHLTRGYFPNHAVTLYGYELNTDGTIKYWKIFDHYRGNEKKKLAPDYPFGAAMKFAVTKLAH